MASNDWNIATSSRFPLLKTLCQDAVIDSFVQTCKTLKDLKRPKCTFESMVILQNYVWFSVFSVSALCVRSLRSLRVCPCRPSKHRIESNASRFQKSTQVQAITGLWAFVSVTLPADAEHPGSMNAWGDSLPEYVANSRGPQSRDISVSIQKFCSAFHALPKDLPEVTRKWISREG